ncbi:cytochrome c oxidase subunit 3 family protein [Pseudorhodobacter sp. W20_MBD10_FR17]|uniref:cytochrome c oxidase subunit 3 family protein n=1 Tax=Pseudorhodobacter sp. W20_MBD10_FR17 TaxID=3240266 RepID=UPI003F9AB8E6
MTDTSDQSSLDQLPGDLMMWVLIISELLVLGAGLLAFMAVRITDPAGFAAAQDHLHRTAAGVNTVVLVTSGYIAARALAYAKAGRVAATRWALLAAAALGVLFLAIKFTEFAEKASQGITPVFHLLLSADRASRGPCHCGAGHICLARPTPNSPQPRGWRCVLAYGRSGLGAVISRHLPAALGGGMQTITRAWLMLLALSAASTAVSFWRHPTP